MYLKNCFVQNALVENNEIFETLKAENAGLKEKIKVIESQHERELTRGPCFNNYYYLI